MAMAVLKVCNLEFRNHWFGQELSLHSCFEKLFSFCLRGFGREVRDESLEAKLLKSSICSTRMKKLPAVSSWQKVRSAQSGSVSSRKWEIIAFGRETHFSKHISYYTLYFYICSIV